MTRVPPNPRAGISLTEVLVALFVMAIGMLSLLTLFPLGAMQVGQALRDDRCTQLAHQADGYIRAAWRTDIVGREAVTGESYYWTLDDPYLVVKYTPTTPAQGQVMRFLGSNAPAGVSWYNSAALLVSPVTLGNPAAAPTNNSPTQYCLTGEAVRPPPAGLTLGTNERYVERATPLAAGPSYPVVFDPTGLNAISSARADRAWVGYAASPVAPHLPRRTCSAVNPFPPAAAAVSAFELTSLTDDMTFQPDGRPDPLDLGRQGRYSYAAVLQRPNNADRYVADLWILVYDGRPVLPRSGDEYVAAPVAAATAGQRTVQVDLPTRAGDTDPVLLRRGGWLIDGTIDNPTGTPAGSRRHFHPYRVSGYTEVGPGAAAGTTRYDVDLETPLVAPLTVATPAAPASQLYFLAGLTEVFTRPKLRPDVNY